MTQLIETGANLDQLKQILLDNFHAWGSLERSLIIGGQRD
jgi:hypothetical protein